MVTVINTPTTIYAPLPFTILIDTAEQQPFSFSGMKSDAKHGNREYLIEQRTPDNPDGRLHWTCLGRHPHSYGDYSVEGFNRAAGDELGIHLERKSISDVIGTVCGWGDRRDRFLAELKNLEQINRDGFACVVVEGSFQTCVASVQATDKRSQGENRIAFHRSIISIQQEHCVPWFFCDSRRFAEATAFRFLEKAWRKLTK